MIRFLEHTELNLDAYDACVAGAAVPSPYALSWFLEIVSAGKWGALVKGDYEAVFPLCYRSRLGSEIIYQPLFTQQLGVLSASAYAEADPQAFLCELPARFRSLQINLFPGQEIKEDPFSGNRFSRDEGVTHHLSLDQPAAALHKEFSENTRRNIRKAQKADLKVNFSETATNVWLARFMEILMANQAPGIEGLTPKDYQRIPRLMKACSDRKAGEFVSISKGGEMIAGLFFLKRFNWLINLFGSSSAEARKSGAMALGMSAFIERHCETNQTIDFEGSMIPGIARFYRSFGSEVVHFQRIRSNRFSWLERLVQRG